VETHSPAPRLLEFVEMSSRIGHSVVWLQLFERGLPGSYDILCRCCLSQGLDRILPVILFENCNWRHFQLSVPRGFRFGKPSAERPPRELKSGCQFLRRENTGTELGWSPHGKYGRMIKNCDSYTRVRCETLKTGLFVGSGPIHQRPGK
jgi:hypothetical protein